MLLINITVATLKGPGRCTDIWLDEESRALAAAQQIEVHRAYEKAHGLPGWIEAVDNEASRVSVILFGGFDPILTNDFRLKSRVAALVAEDSPRCYDQVNDRMYSEILEIKIFRSLLAAAESNSSSRRKTFWRVSAPAASFDFCLRDGHSTTSRGKRCCGRWTTESNKS